MTTPLKPSDFAKCEKCIHRFTCTVDPRGKRCAGPVLRIK